MTDLSSFSSNDFDACSWINSQLQDVPHGETVETYLSALSVKLHLAAQDYSEQLETAMVESMSSMPRMVAEINRLEDQLQVIHSEMKNLADHINAVDKRSVTGVEELSRLDGLKSSMEKCKSTLEEHARWSQLVREARQLLESGGTLSETADRIEIMFRSLDVLRELPGHEERQETCTSYRQSLLDALLPNVQAELQSMGMTSLQEYLYVFRKLGREDEYEREYLLCRPRTLLDKWNACTTTSSEPLSQSLAFFLGYVTKFISDEEEAVVELFGSAQRSRMLTAVLCEALKPMTTQLPELLRQSDNVVVATECGHVLDEFCKRILALIASDELAHVTQSLQAIFAGFWLYQPHYVEAEERVLRRALLQAIEAVTFRASTDGALCGLEEDLELDLELQDPLELLTSFADGLLPALDRFFASLSQGLERVAQHLGGTALKSFCRALVGVLQQLSRYLTLKLDVLGVALGLPPHQDSQASGTDVYRSYAEEVKLAGKVAALLQASEVDKKSVAACALRALQSVGRYKRCLEDAESLLRRCCSQSLAYLAAHSTLRVEDTVAWPHAPGVCYAVGQVQAEDNLLAETRAFLTVNSALASSFAQGSFSALVASPRKLAMQAGLLLVQLCVSPLLRLLEGYRFEGEGGRAASDTEDMDALRDQMLPQSIVTQIGESVLSWVQDLENFASSDALVDLISIRGEALPLSAMSAGWRALAMELDLKDDKALAQLAGRQSAAKGVQAFERELSQAGRMHGVKLRLVHELAGESDLNDEDASANQVAVFVNEWLAALADSIVGAFLAHLLANGVEDGAQSAAARAQLCVDVDYLCNVVNATGIRCHPLLVHVQHLSRESPSHMSKLLKLLAAGKNLGSLKDLLQLDLALTAAIHGHVTAAE